MRHYLVPLYPSDYTEDEGNWAKGERNDDEGDHCELASRTRRSFHDDDGGGCFFNELEEAWEE